ncbi:hypothetical protein D3C85_1327160 [compost metagenome]
MSVIEPGTAIPGAVPGTLVEVALQCHRAVAAAFGKCVIPVQASGHRKLLQHLIAEEAQPDTFTCTQMADAIHAVIPVTGAHQRQSVMATAQAMFDGTHAMLIQ